MQFFINQLLHLPVNSLQSGHVIAQISGFYFDPANLSVAAFKLKTSRWHDSHEVLLFDDIRKFTPDNLLIDNDNNIGPINEVVRLQALKERDFKLSSAIVKTELGQILGKVEDAVLTTDSSLIIKLYVRQSLITNPLQQDLIIARDQVVDVQDQDIIVKNLTTETPSPVKRLLSTKKLLPEILPPENA